jgi:hypothetical protein
VKTVPFLESGTGMDQKIVFAMMALAQKNKTVGRLSDILYRKASMLFFNLYAGAGLYLVLFGDRKIYLYVLVPFCCLLTGYALRSAIKRKRPYQRY